jgi:hypothetical protein
LAFLESLGSSFDKDFSSVVPFSTAHAAPGHAAQTEPASQNSTLVPSLVKRMQQAACDLEQALYSLPPDGIAIPLLFRAADVTLQQQLAYSFSLEEDGLQILDAGPASSCSPPSAGGSP